MPEKDKMFLREEAQPFLFEGDGHGVLVLHGFTGTVSHMRPLGEHLRDMGFTVRGINLPGHAESIDAMAQTGWRDWLGAAREAVRDLRKNCDTVSAAGLSMGGVITLILAEEGLLDSAVTISAPMAAQNRLLALARVLSVLKPRFEWGNEGEAAGEDPVLDPKYHLGYAGFPTKCGQDLYHLIRMARKNLSQITCPLLSIQSHADETISADSLDIIQSGVQSKTRQSLWLEGVPHVCVISREKERINQACGEFLRKTEKKG